MNLGSVVFVAGLVLAPSFAFAQEEAAKPCAATDVSLPSEMSGWTTKADLAAAADKAGLAKAALSPGHAVTATLLHTPAVTYPGQPAKPGGSVAYGGLLSLIVKQAGTYRIGLSSGAWLDVVEGGKLALSSAHGHGPACSTIRKIVDFPLKPGRYVVQISANAEPSLGLMVWRQP